MEQVSSDVAKLVTPEEYQAARKHLFPSETSWRWQFRQHRQQMLRSGAVLKIANRFMVDPERCDAVVLEIGRADALRRLEV